MDMEKMVELYGSTMAAEQTSVFVMHKTSMFTDHLYYDKLTTLRVYGYISIFSAISTKEINFFDSLFASQADRALLTGGLLLMEAKYSKGSNIFPLGVHRRK